MRRKKRTARSGPRSWAEGRWRRENKSKKGGEGAAGALTTAAAAPQKISSEKRGRRRRKRSARNEKKELESEGRGEAILRLTVAEWEGKDKRGGEGERRRASRTRALIFSFPLLKPLSLLVYRSPTGRRCRASGEWRAPATSRRPIRAGSDEEATRDASRARVSAEASTTSQQQVYSWPAAASTVATLPDENLPGLWEKRIHTRAVQAFSFSFPFPYPLLVHLFTRFFSRATLRFFVSLQQETS